MNTIVTIGAVILVGIVLAVVIGLMIKKCVVGATFKADLTNEDRKEIAEMKAFLETMRRERSEQNADQAARAGRIEAQIEHLGKTTGTLGASASKLERALQ